MTISIVDLNSCPKPTVSRGCRSSGGFQKVFKGINQVFIAWWFWAVVQGTGLPLNLP